MLCVLVLMRWTWDVVHVCIDEVGVIAVVGECVPVGTHV